MVQGCFWHRHEGCRYASTPATRPEFWQRKFTQTVARDQKNLARLRERGWRVALIWECALRQAGADVVAAQVADWVMGKDELLSVE